MAPASARQSQRGCALAAPPVWSSAGKAAVRRPMVGQTMSRVIAVAACGFILAACSMSMPSLDFFRSAPPTEVLRIESEPPGADARTAEGQTCRTPAN